MTKQEQIEQIRAHLRAIRNAATPEVVWSVEKIVSLTRQELYAIEKLLQEPESEGLASSVLRLTDPCNRLEAENHKLKEDLCRADARIEDLEEGNRQLRDELVLWEAGCRMVCACLERIMEQTQP